MFGLAYVFVISKIRDNARHNNLFYYTIQAAYEADSGRFVKVYDFFGNEKFHINLDIDDYGLGSDDLCIHSKGAFLAVASSEKILLRSE